MIRITYQKILCQATLALIFPMSIALADETPRILFVCGGDTGRSPMAESLANDYFHFGAAGYEAYSRGLRVNHKEILPEKNAVIVMHQWTPTTQMDSHRATPITVADIDRADIVLAMTAAQKETLLMLDPKAARKIFMLSQCANGTTQDIHDMYAHDLSVYQQTSKQIAHYLQLIKSHQFSCYNDVTQPILLSLNTMTDNWNRSDLKAFLEVYNPSPSTIYVSSTGQIIRGIAAITKRFYSQYPNTAKMGHLDTSEVSIQILSENYAAVTGKWHLTRRQEGDIGGVFSLIYRKTDQGWKIELDHTS